MSVINAGAGGRPLPVLTNPGGAGDLLAGKQLIDQYGSPITGLIPTKGAGDLTVSGAGIIVPAGYYAEQVSKEVPAAAQAVPTISVSSAGLITASAAQEAGYVAAGTKSATKQLTTQAGKTITPGTTQQTAVASGRYTTGAVYVAGDADLKAANIKSGVNIFGVAGTYAGPSLFSHIIFDLYLSGNPSTITIPMNVATSPKQIYGIQVFAKSTRFGRYEEADSLAGFCIVPLSTTSAMGVSFGYDGSYIEVISFSNGFSSVYTISGSNVQISSEIISEVTRDGMYGFDSSEQAYWAQIVYSV